MANNRRPSSRVPERRSMSKEIDRPLTPQERDEPSFEHQAEEAARRQRLRAQSSLYGTLVRDWEAQSQSPDKEVRHAAKQCLARARRARGPSTGDILHTMREEMQPLGESSFLAPASGGADALPTSNARAVDAKTMLRRDAIDLLPDSYATWFSYQGTLQPAATRQPGEQER